MIRLKIQEIFKKIWECNLSLEHQNFAIRKQLVQLTFNFVSGIHFYEDSKTF